MTYRALLIGNSVFDADASLNPLNAPTKDVARLHRALVDSATGLFSDEHVRLVVERTSDDLLDELDLFFAAAHRDDLLLLYYSGHGLLDDRNQLFLCGRNTRSDRLLRTAVSNVRINEFIEQSVARCSVIILDCCSSGMFKGGGDVAMPLAGPGRYVVSSTRGAALANDAAVPTGTSLFTEHLVTGLMGGAEDRDGDGFLDLREIYDYVRTRLTANTKQIPHSRFDGDAAVVLARRPEAPRKPGPVQPGRLGDPAFVLSENEINLNDVDPGERLNPEIVEIYRLGEAELDCRAATEASWLRAEVRGQRVVVELHPLMGHNRAKIRVLDRNTRTAQVLRVHVFMRAPAPPPPRDDKPSTDEPSQNSPATDAPPESNKPPGSDAPTYAAAPVDPGPDAPTYAAGPIKPDSETRVTASFKGGPNEPTRVLARASVKMPAAAPPARPPTGDPPGRREAGSGGFRGRRRTVVFAVASVLLLTAAGTAYGLGARGGGDAAVPRLVGLTRADAEEKLRSAGLKASLVPATSASCAAGQVVAQSPAADRTTRSGSTVAMTVCGFVAPSASASVPAGTPSAGATTPSPPAQTTRTTTEAPPPARVSVPDLGDTEDSARRALERAGLRAAFENDSSTAAKGQVIGSLPKAGKRVEPGSRVTVFLSLADLVKVPDVVGVHVMNSPSFTLEAKGLNTQIQCIDADGPGGTVASQDPRGGAEVEKGTTVTLEVINGLTFDDMPCMR